MKLTKSKLKQIIKEELRKVLQEKGPQPFARSHDLLPGAISGGRSGRGDMSPYQHDYLDYEDCAERMPPYGLGSRSERNGCYGGWQGPLHSGISEEEYFEQCDAYCRDKVYPGDWVGSRRHSGQPPAPEAPAGTKLGHPDYTRNIP